jgi:hypothetical protein
VLPAFNFGLTVVSHCDTLVFQSSTSRAELKLLFTILIVAVLALVLVAPSVDLPSTVLQDISGAILLLVGAQVVASLLALSPISHLPCTYPAPCVVRLYGRSASLLFGEFRC